MNTEKANMCNVKQKLTYRGSIMAETANFKSIPFYYVLRLWQENNSISLKESTKLKYDNLIKTHIVPELGNRNITDISPSEINAFLNNKLICGKRNGRGGLSASYVRSIALIISSALSFAVDEGFCERPNGRIGKPIIPKKDIIVMTYLQQKKLEKNIQCNMSPTHIGILISLYTGLRIGEVCALSWNDIDLNQKIITVNHTISRVKNMDEFENKKTKLILDTPKTRSSKRQIPIPSTLHNVLCKYKDLSYSSYVVSHDDSFVSPRTFEARYHRILNDCMIEPINYHVLRHTFATRCMEVGVDVKSLSEILGHANVSITLNTYVHSSMEMKKRQLEKLSHVITI